MLQRKCWNSSNRTSYHLCCRQSPVNTSSATGSSIYVCHYIVFHIFLSLICRLRSNASFLVNFILFISPYEWWWAPVQWTWSKRTFYVISVLSATELLQSVCECWLLLYCVVSVIANDSHCFRLHRILYSVLHSNDCGWVPSLLAVTRVFINYGTSHTVCHWYVCITDTPAITITSQWWRRLVNA